MPFKFVFHKKQEPEKVCSRGVVRIETGSDQEKLEKKSTEFLQKLSIEEANLIEEKQNLATLKEKLLLTELSSEEANLMEERQNLASLKEKLQLKVQEKIELKKNNVQKIRDEIKELKFSCEELIKTLKVGTNVK